MSVDPAVVARVIQERWDEEAQRFVAAIAPFGIAPEVAVADLEAIDPAASNDPAVNEAYGALMGVIDVAAATGVSARLLRRFPR